MPSGRGSAKPNEPEGKRSATEARALPVQYVRWELFRRFRIEGDRRKLHSLIDHRKRKAREGRRRRGPDTGAASVQDGAYRRRLRYPRSLARGKAFVLPTASARGLWVCPPRHLRAQAPGGDIDCALVLPKGSSHVQPVARSPGGALSGDVIRDRAGSGYGGAGEEPGGGRRRTTHRSGQPYKRRTLGAPARGTGTQATHRTGRVVAAVLTRLYSDDWCFARATVVRAGADVLS